MGHLLNLLWNKNQVYKILELERGVTNNEIYLFYSYFSKTLKKMPMVQ